MFQKPKSQASIGESYNQSKNLKVYLIHIDYFIFRFAIHKTLDSTLEILDPLPSQFSRERFHTYLYNFETDCEINSVNLQRRNSDSCGPMVIYYCYTRFMNEDIFFEDYLNLYFDKSVSRNETIIKEFLDELQQRQ